MKSSEIRAMQTEDIQGKLIENQLLLTKLKFAHSMSPIENPKRIQFIRKVIARLHTELKERSLNPNDKEE